MDDAGRWHRVKQVFHDALDRPADERGPFLHRACGEDRELHGEVESLLAAHAAAGSFVLGPAIEALAPSAADALRDGAWAERRVQRGDRLGHYELLSVLGTGGMGEVWQARDTTLHRDVAIKLVRDGFAQDVDRLDRLAREATLLASLNHPNIATIHGLEADQGTRFLVLELVEGRTLADRLARGALAVEDSLKLALQIADALDTAHEKGVVHRDLKPANIKVTPEGRVKVLDFGLAKALAPAFDDDHARPAAPSDVGVILGTPAYMSPEQARGDTVGRQADIWSFGVVLYELLTGVSPFGRQTTADTLASVLGTHPDYAVLPEKTPANVRYLVRRCLDKDRQRRWQHMGDVRIEVEEALFALTAAERYRCAADVRLVLEVSTGAPLPPSPLLGLTIGQTGFVGRDRELAQMDLVWTRVTSGARHLILLAGEPGIGKTRLASEFARVRSASAATVLAGRCDEEALVPYQPFVEALSWYVRVCPERDLRAQLAAIGGGVELGPLIPEVLRRVPDLPPQPAMNPEGQRYRLFEAVAGLLAQASLVRPMMLVFDDLHWADKPTLLMLRHVVRASSAAPLCLVGTYRENELTRTHPLAEMLSNLRREPAVTRLSLRGLEEAHVKGLIDAFVGREAPPRLAHLITGSTEGNPFFIGEMLRHLTETGALTAFHTGSAGKGAAALGLPEGVKEVIGRRLSRLSEACNRTLSLAAVMGREFAIEVLEALGDLPEDRLLDAIDEGVHAQLIAEAPDRAGRFTFVHALIRETLYEELTTTRRVRLHRRVGEAIERLAACG